MMAQLKRDDLYTLEEYARIRKDYRASIMAHKKSRTLPVGPNATLYFEDRQTMQYQVQEMLRIEKIFEEDGIQDELAAYNPLIPDGTNWKATFMIEYGDVAERQKMLARLLGIEKVTWVQVAGYDKVYPIANEDMDRETADKTSSVHFLRFELSPAMIAAVKGGAGIAAGIEHPDYSHEVVVPRHIRDSLAGDLA
jgi:hypothetical protein